MFPADVNNGMPGVRVEMKSSAESFTAIRMEADRWLCQLRVVGDGAVTKSAVGSWPVVSRHKSSC